jgi:hypothetical protein
MTSCALFPAPAVLTLRAVQTVELVPFCNWASVHPEDFATLAKGARHVQVRIGNPAGRPMVLLLQAVKDDTTLDRGSVHLNEYQLRCIKAFEGDELPLEVVPFGSHPPLDTLELYVELVEDWSFAACAINRDMVAQVFVKAFRGHTLRLGQELYIRVAEAEALPLKVTGTRPSWPDCSLPCLLGVIHWSHVCSCMGSSWTFL